MSWRTLTRAIGVPEKAFVPSSVSARAVIKELRTGRFACEKSLAGYVATMNSSDMVRVLEAGGLNLKEVKAVLDRKVMTGDLDRYLVRAYDAYARLCSPSQLDIADGKGREVVEHLEGVCRNRARELSDSDVCSMIVSMKELNRDEAIVDLMATRLNQCRGLRGPVDRYIYTCLAIGNSVLVTTCRRGTMAREDELARVLEWVLPELCSVTVERLTASRNAHLQGSNLANLCLTILRLSRHPACALASGAEVRAKKALQMLGDYVLETRLERRLFRDVQELVDYIDVFSGVHPAPVHESVLEFCYALLLEDRKYLHLSKEQASIVLKTASAADHSNSTLTQMLSRSCAELEASSSSSGSAAVRALIGFCDSNCHPGLGYIHSLTCQAMLGRGTFRAAEVGEILAAICHHWAGVCGAGVNRVAAVINEMPTHTLSGLDLPSLSACAVGLALHGVALSCSGCPEDVVCECNSGNAHPDFDYRSTRVVVKAYTTYHDGIKRMRNARRKNASTPLISEKSGHVASMEKCDLHFEYAQQPAETSLKANVTAFMKIIELLTLASAKSVESSGMWNENYAIIDETFSLSRGGNGSDAQMLPLNAVADSNKEATQLCLVPKRTSIVPAGLESYLTEVICLDNIKWATLDRATASIVCGDNVMALQLLWNNTAARNLLTLEDLRIVKSLAVVSEVGVFLADKQRGRVSRRAIVSSKRSGSVEQHVYRVMYGLRPEFASEMGKTLEIQRNVWVGQFQVGVLLTQYVG